MNALPWLEDAPMNDPVAGVKKLIGAFGGSFPTTGRGLLNILRQLESSSALPPALAAQAARWPVRAVGAFIPAFDGQPIELVKFCGVGHISAVQAVAMVEGMSFWEGEASPPVIRGYLGSIAAGVHPDTAADRWGISDEDKLHLEYLLETRQFWHDCVVERVYTVRASGGGWFKTARELGTFRPGVVNSWIRACDHFAGTGIYPKVEPLVEIPDSFE